MNRLIHLTLSLLLSLSAHAAGYTYDKLHRLTSVTYDSGESVTYRYDAAGNLLSARMAGQVVEYRVSGVITGPSTGSGNDGNPLAGAQVTLNGQTVTTGADGAYRFDGLKPGEYTLTVTLDGWLTQTRTVTLSENNPVLNLALTLLPRPPVTGVLFAAAQSCANNSQTVSANRIRVYTLDGQFIRDFDSGFTGKGIALSATDFDVAAAQLAKGNEIRLFDAAGTGLGTLLLNMDNKGIQAAFTDLNNDGAREILIASQAADTRVYRYRADGTPEQTLTLLSKATEFKIAAGDMTGDGKAEIVLALSKQSAGPNLSVFDATGRLLSSFTALPGKASTGSAAAPGLTVAVADLDGDGRAEIIAGNAEKNVGFEAGVYSAQGAQLSRFAAYPANNGVPPDLAGCTDYAAQGLLLAAAPSTSSGTGRGQIFAALNGGREVRVFNPNGSLLRAFPAAGADAALSGLSLGAAE